MRKVVFAINITTDGYCNHTDMIADEEITRSQMGKVTLKRLPPGRVEGDNKGREWSL